MADVDWFNKQADGIDWLINMRPYYIDTSACGLN